MPQFEEVVQVTAVPTHPKLFHFRFFKQLPVTTKHTLLHPWAPLKE